MAEQEEPRQTGFSQEKPEFKTLKAFEQKYGTKNFIEVAIKVPVSKDGEGDKFFSIAKGYYDKVGNKRYKTSLGFTATEEMKKFILDSFKEL